MMTDQQQHQDDETYSSKIGLKCAQHEHLDCRAFIDVGFSADEVNELMSRCPQSCSSSPTLPSSRTSSTTIDDKQQHRSLQTFTLGQNDAIGGNECLNPGWKDNSCRDDPGFLADALLLPCESFQMLECEKLDAIGLNEQQVHTIINACPCSCDIPCGTWTMSPTAVPTSAPTVSPQPTTAMPTGRPTPQPSPNPTMQPSRSPTQSPTTRPTKAPTWSPTKQPSASPTKGPTKAPSSSPTIGPTKAPSSSPTIGPTGTPTTLRPTLPPSKAPTPFPTTARPTISMKPSPSPSASPTLAPSISAMPTTSDYWAAASVWQENKQSFQGLIVIFGAVGVALFGVGLIALYRMKRTSRDDRGKLLQGMGYGPSSGGGDKNPPKKKNSRMERSSRSKREGKKGKNHRRSSSKGKVKFAEPNVRSNNARVPAAIYEQPISNQQPPVVDPMDGLVDIAADPQLGWLDNYALRHQPRKAAQTHAVVPNASDEFATLGTARSSSSTLNTKTTKGTLVSKVSQKSNGSGKGSIIVFEQPSKRAAVPKNDEMKEKKNTNDSLLKALPFAGRDRTAETAPIEEDLEVVESMENPNGKSVQGQTTSMQYVLPPHREESDQCSGKKVGHIFRWKAPRKTGGGTDEGTCEEPVGLIEQPHRAQTDSHSERRRHSRSRQRKNEEVSPDNTKIQNTSVQVETTRGAPVAPSQHNDEAGADNRKANLSTSGAWLPTTMFGSPPRADIETDDCREVVLTSVPTSEHQQSVWKAWVPGDIPWMKPAVATQVEQMIDDIEQGNVEQPEPRSSQSVEKSGYFPSMPQVDWPAWMANTAAPSELSEARQQTSIMSPTTEDGIGINPGAFNFVRSPKKWLKQSKGKIEVV